MEISDLANGNTAVTSDQSDDPALITFNISYNADFTPIELQQTQTVTVVIKTSSKYFIDGVTQTLFDVKTFTVSFINPCTDPNYVKIVGPTQPLADEDYIIEDAAEPLTQHTEFTIEYTPNVHDFCGGITVVPKYDDEILDNSVPVTYSVADRRFTAESDD